MFIFFLVGPIFSSSAGSSIVEYNESALREVTLTTGGGDYKIREGITKLWDHLWGDHKILSTFYGGDHKINFRDGIKIGVFFFIIKNFPLLRRFPSNIYLIDHLYFEKLHGIATTHDDLW